MHLFHHSHDSTVVMGIHLLCKFQLEIQVEYLGNHHLGFLFSANASIPSMESFI